jgi:hypothetical protein
MRPSNKRMKLTKLSAAPGWSPTTVRTEVPPRAREGRIDAGTASQLIRGVRRTSKGDRRRDMRTVWIVCLGMSLAGCAARSVPKPPPEAQYGARVETEIAVQADSVRAAFSLRNVWSRTGPVALVVFTVSHDPTPVPRSVVSPEGWKAYLELCRSSHLVCGIEWRREEAGQTWRRQDGFEVVFSGTSPPRISSRCVTSGDHDGECEVTIDPNKLDKGDKIGL